MIIKHEPSKGIFTYFKNGESISEIDAFSLSDEIIDYKDSDECKNKEAAAIIEKTNSPIMDEILSLESQCARPTIKLSSLLSAPSPDLVAINSEREFLNEKLATIEALRATLNIN